MLKFPKIQRKSLLLAFLVMPLLSPIITQGNERKALLIEQIKIDSPASLVHIGNYFENSPEGIEAATQLLDTLETGNLKSAQTASEIYDKIIPRENFGGDYTALQWFAWYFLASDTEKAKILANPYHREFFNFWAENDFANLKEYLQRIYRLKEFPDGRTFKGYSRVAFLEDMMRDSNPRRGEWEKTSEIIEVLNLNSGMTVADIGSGSGYFTFKFAEAVGSDGKVFAIDAAKDHEEYIEGVAKRNNLNNVEFVHLPKADNIGVEANQLDLAYMSYVYHIVYTVTYEEVRERYLNDLKDALKPDGRLVVVDNGMIPDDVVPYHGPFISKELVIAQLERYGFELESQYQFIPQRYVLVFKKA